MNLKKRSFLKKKVLSGNGQILAHSFNTPVQTGITENTYSQTHLLVSYNFSHNLHFNAGEDTASKSLQKKTYNELISPLLFEARAFLNSDKKDFNSTAGMRGMSHALNRRFRISYR
ncbi:hypothetical protein ACTJKC_15885 [Pedobacter sp. 22226]|uniref:hypothetical protein n=1 Tax=Pedobacter sp. 22226 TaxID=3453894 RepID=UPI003F879A73